MTPTLAAFACLLGWPGSRADAAGETPTWRVPDIDSLPDDAVGRQVRFGRDLVVRTPALIGPEVSDVSKRYAGNNLSCENCHLAAGTKPSAMPLVGVAKEFPQYRPRSGQINALSDRINGCMTRSMNGRPLPVDGPEMSALVAYLEFLSTEVPVGVRLEGHGPGHMPELTRAADPDRGRVVYRDACLRCHGSAGQGVRSGCRGDAQGFVIPPLWGNDSFNDGAGMQRLINAANFIHGNMPQVAIAGSWVLTPEEAWDVAAYIEAQPRPHDANLEQDFPDRSEKPPDTPYGPYVDGFTLQQHLRGPFEPIRRRLAQFPHRRRLFEAAPSSPSPQRSPRSSP